jgi:hypothetical protein
LGLIVDAANRARLVTHLVSLRPNSPQPETYTLRLTGENPIELDIASHSNASTRRELDPRALAATEGEAPMLVTTAVGAGFGDCCNLLVEIAEARSRSGAPTVFIACENNTGSRYTEVKQQLEALGVECRETMVNRLCPERSLGNDDKLLVVRADPYAEWLIEGDGGKDPLGQIAGVRYVEFKPDVRPFGVRKRWLVNGAHLALALFARPVNQPRIREAVRDPERRRRIEALQEDMVEVLPSEWQQALGDSREYAREQLVPMARTEDDASRILGRLKRVDLAPFLEDANRKLGEPARRSVAETGSLSGSFEDVFDNLHDVLLNIDHYTDARDIRRGEAHLSEQKDQEAVAAYEQLLDGVVSGETKSVRRDQLVRRLHRHHVVFGNGGVEV